MDGDGARRGQRQAAVGARRGFWRPVPPDHVARRVLLRVVADGVGGRGEDDAADVAEDGPGQPGSLGQTGRQVLSILAHVTLVNLQNVNNGWLIKILFWYRGNRMIK